MANNIGSKTAIRAVALDFDGVITTPVLDIDWNAAIRQASAIAGYDVKSLLTFYEKCFGTQLFKKVSDEMEKTELEAVKTAQPAPSIKEFLQKLSEKRIEVYVVSMQTSKAIKWFLEKHALANYFTDVITREMFPTKKAQVETILKRMGISPNQLLFVDDSKANIHKCEELRAVCFYFKSKTSPEEIRQTWNKLLNLASNN